MGASSVVDPSKIIDPSIGALVWVRRRNGWWWPGQIISEDELPEGCIQMPRSGTPVKLLGKEEAIVDWYNLEKSKRVKPFRCGEYTDCIEKAKASASASNFSKKRVKYARREDAILEALELESACLGKNQSPFVQEMQEEKQCNIDESHSSIQSGKVEEHIEENATSKLELDSVSGPELSQSGVSFEEPSNQIPTANKISNYVNAPNDSEDDGNGGVKKRMKGLEDIGMCGAAAASPLKRKGSQISHVPESLKRKNRRRTLTKVLERTTMVSSHVDSKDLSGLNESSVPGSSDEKVICLESNGLRKCSSLVTNNNSDSTGVLCDTEISENLDQESSQSLFDVPLVAEEKYTPGSIDAYRMSQMAQKATSEWQLKGKRNSRSRKNDVTETNATLSKENDSSTVPGENLGSKAEPVSQPRPNPEIQSEPISQRVLPCRSSRFTPNPKYDSSDFSLSHRTIGSGLYEVKVHVEATPPAQHAPCITLMSKLYNLPITGYPIDIEILEDGYCDNLITVSECYSSTSQLKYVSDFRNVEKVCERMPARGAKPKGKKNTKKSSNKSKKKNGEKIRKLSSLSNKKPLVEKMKGPLLACVPLKVVFSRINADLNSSIRCMK